VNGAAPAAGGEPAVPLIFELRDVRAGYGPIEVVHGVSLEVPGGTVVALLGPNGGGKTTLLNVCAGTLATSSGEVRFEDTTVTRVSADDRARRGICTVPEGRGIFPNLTVRENLLMATQVGIPMDRIEDVAYSQFPQLSGRRKQMAGTLSGGEQQMLALARAFATDPKLLLLDELSMGLAPIVVGQLYDKVKELAAAGLSILLVEQFARTALPIADSAAVVLQGVIAHRGTPAEMEEALATSYLGS
jgi:branched-chain amino acid transport system ATP-binding protein